MSKIVDKIFNKVMPMEYLAKYLLACGIGVNILIVAWAFSYVIDIIASL
jgi:hypothetical protein